MTNNVLVPGIDHAPGSHRLANGDPLLLPARNTPDSRVSHSCILGMSQSKDSRQDLCHKVNIFTPSLSLKSSTRCSCLRSELDGLLDSESRKVDIIFRTVLNVSAEVVSDLIMSERIIKHVSFDGVVLLSLIGECLEKRATT